jgi:hypothetical protein
MENPKKGYKLITFMEEYGPAIGRVIRVLFYAMIAVVGFFLWLLSGLKNTLPDSHSTREGRSRW